MGKAQIALDTQAREISRLLLDDTESSQPDNISGQVRLAAKPVPRRFKPWNFTARRPPSAEPESLANPAKHCRSLES